MQKGPCLSDKEKRTRWPKEGLWMLTLCHQVGDGNDCDTVDLRHRDGVQ
jgi:hypothetical protein